MEPGKVGIWWSGTCPAPTGPAVQRPPRWNRWATGALWCSGGFDHGFLSLFGWLLDAIEHIPAASGILSILHANPAQAADGAAALDVTQPGRYLLGLGASHAPVVEQLGTEY